MAFHVDVDSELLLRLLEVMGHPTNDETAQRVKLDFDNLDQRAEGVCICWHCNNESSSTLQTSALLQTSIGSPFLCGCGVQILPYEDGVCGNTTCHPHCHERQQAGVCGIALLKLVCSVYVDIYTGDVPLCVDVV